MMSVHPCHVRKRFLCTALQMRMCLVERTECTFLRAKYDEPDSFARVVPQHLNRGGAVLTQNSIYRCVEHRGPAFHIGN